MWATNL
jgi:hypothetical protein